MSNLSMEQRCNLRYIAKRFDAVAEAMLALQGMFVQPTKHEEGFVHTASRIQSIAENAAHYIRTQVEEEDKRDVYDANGQRDAQGAEVQGPCAGQDVEGGATAH